jgi:threonylcarbamoyladenosine tRNA methylthiotransferase CDKAL1
MLDLPKIRKNALVEIIPLSTGCLGSCTYCKTRHARGKLGSYDPEAIVERAKQAVSEGVMEIWLTSEDTGAYGRDIGTDLPTLLKAIIEVLPDHVMLRLGMTNPPFILEHLQAMADIMRHPRVYSFLHVPVQSGSNPVLEKMNREYTVEEFNEVCDFLIEFVPGMTVATDIICGFPTEDLAHHKETCRLVEKYQFPVINISQFYPRPGTVAAKWKKVLTSEVKKRSSEITNIFNSYSTNGHLIGSEQLVWIIGFDDRKTNAAEARRQLMGHTKSYTKVVLLTDKETLGTDQPPEALIGKCVKIKVTDTHKWHVAGHVIDLAPEPIKVSADYFVKLDEARKEALLKEMQPPVKVSKDHMTHLVGMAFVSVATFLLLESLFM